MTPFNVLVTGATGRQGGAVARALLDRGHRVRALTRRPTSPEALHLKERGAEIIKGALEDPFSLMKAFRGADAAFAMTPRIAAGMESEMRYGIALADAARAAHVRHVIFASAARADHDAESPYFSTKRRIEEYIRRAYLPYTIIAPAYFMDNLLTTGSLQKLRDGRYAFGQPPGRAVQQVALADVASFTARVIERPDRFIGKRIDIASDEITGAKAAEILSRVLGRTIAYEEILPSRVNAVNGDYSLMLEWTNCTSYQADIESLHRYYPEVGWHTFEEWARAQDWTALLTGKKAA